jgi:hypothetical protein
VGGSLEEKSTKAFDKSHSTLLYPGEEPVLAL